MTTISSTQAASPTGSTTAAQATRLQDTVHALAQTFATALLESLGSSTRAAAPAASSTQATTTATASGAASTSAATAERNSTAAPWRAPWLAGAENASSYLHAPDADAATRQSGKPDTATFMKATGADFSTASSLLYGVMGSNEDFRDWNAIMAAPDPVLAARQATGAQYQSSLPYASQGGGFTPGADQILAQSGPYAWLRVEDREGLWLLDGQGQALRQMPLSAPDILRASRDFGMDVGKLTDLADQMDALGVRYQPGQMHAGSNHGVDLRSLASGGMGAAYDWTSDPLARLKGPGAQDAVAANARLAQELGLTPYRGAVATAGGNAGHVAAPAHPGPETANTAGTGGADSNALLEQLLAQLQAALANPK